MSLYQCLCFLSERGGSRVNLVDAKEFTDPVTLNFTTCNILATIKWTGEVKEKLAQSSTNWRSSEQMMTLVRESLSHFPSKEEK